MVACGWVPVSPWWWKAIERAYRSGKRNIPLRGGRRGGKSSTIIGRVAIAEMLAPWHVVPPGDIGFFAVLSADKEQAKARIKTAKKALEDLGIKHRATTEEITLDDRPIGIKAFAATLAGVVSFTCIGCICDEMARWRDKDTGSNPAEQVVTSLRPTMSTMPRAIGWFVSSPWSTLDLHHKMIADGDNEAQCVIIGATWEMNPTLTEEDTRKLEPDYVSWCREYAAIPMASDESKFFAAAFIDAANGQNVTATPDDAVFGLRNGQRVKLRIVHGEQCERSMAGADFAFRRNSSALAVLHKYGETFRLVACEERIPGARPLVPSTTITDLVSYAVAHGAEAVGCDQHYIESVREVLDDLEVPLLEFPTDQEGIAQAYVRTRVLLSEGALDLRLAPPKLIEQLKETTGQPTPGGGIAIRNKIKDGAHGDLVSAFVAAVWSIEQDLPENNNTHTARRFHRSHHMEHQSTLTDYDNYED